MTLDDVIAERAAATESVQAQGGGAFSVGTTSQRRQSRGDRRESSGAAGGVRHRRPPPPKNARPPITLGYNLYVCNLPKIITKADVEYLFNSDNGRSTSAPTFRGVVWLKQYDYYSACIVSYWTQAAAQRMIDTMNGREVERSVIRVEWKEARD